MNYQEEYYKDLQIERELRKTILNRLNHHNSIKYEENGGESETLEDNKERLDWYSAKAIHIESASIQTLYQDYVYNSNFAILGWREYLLDKILFIRIGAIEYVVAKFKGLHNYTGVDITTTTRGKSFRYNFSVDYENAFSEIVKEELWKRDVADRQRYCKFLMFKLAEIFKGRHSQNTEISKEDAESIKGSFTKRYTRLFNKTRDVFKIFSIDIDAIINELSLGRILYRKLGSFSNEVYLELLKDSIYDNEFLYKDLEEPKETKATNKYSSSMTQSQLSTMFRLMRDKGILDINNSQLATLLTSFAGGSHQATRALLGGENAMHINMTLKSQKQVEEIQDTFKELIELLEREKKDIIE